METEGAKEGLHSCTTLRAADEHKDVVVVPSKATRINSSTVAIDIHRTMATISAEQSSAYSCIKASIVAVDVFRLVWDDKFVNDILRWPRNRELLHVVELSMIITNSLTT